MWFEEMINNRNKSVVCDLKWTLDGQKICIVYKEGMIILGSVDGKRLWARELAFQLARVEWSPDGRRILLCTAEGECHTYDEDGNPLSRLIFNTNDLHASSSVIGFEWCIDSVTTADNEKNAAMILVKY